MSKNRFLRGLSIDYPLTHARIKNANDILTQCVAHLSGYVELLENKEAKPFMSVKAKKEYVKSMKDLISATISAKIHLQDPQPLIVLSDEDKANGWAYMDDNCLPNPEDHPAQTNTPQPATDVARSGASQLLG